MIQYFKLKDLLHRRRFFWIGHD